MAEPMDLMDALRETLKNSLIVDGVTKGKSQMIKIIKNYKIIY
jgi:hypothetical protein